MSNLESATLRNPTTGNIIKVRYALSLPHDHPAYILARQRFPKATSRFEFPDPKDAIDNRKEELKRIVDDKIYTETRSMEEIEQFTIDELNGLNPTEVLGEYLDLLDVHDIDEVQNINCVLNQYNNYSFLTLEVILRDGSTISRGIQTFDNSPPEISHDGFTIENRLIGKNVARKMLRGSLKLADKIGAEVIHVHAGLASGGYVWAKYGAVPASGDSDQLLYYARERLENITYQLSRLDNEVEWHAARIKTYFDELRRQYKNGRMSKSSARIRIRNAIMDQRFQNQLKRTVQEARKYIQDNPEMVSTLIDILKNQQGENRYLVNVLARTPLGKLMFLDSSWGGVFETKKGSIGRRLLEDAIK